MKSVFSKYKFNIAVRDLILFVVLFFLALFLRVISKNVILDNIFFLLMVIFGFLAIAFFIVFLIFIFAKIFRK